MNLKVISDRESITAAMDLARQDEQEKVEEAFAEILACKVTETDSYHVWSYPSSDYLEEALRRDRDATIPRLQFIAEGRGGEDEPARVCAATMLSRVDPHIGFRAMLNLLESDDPVTLSETLHQMGGMLVEAEEEGLIRADFVPERTKLERILSFLEHPSRTVARSAVFLLDQLRLAGVSDHYLLPRMDDPVLGDSVRWTLAWEGRESALLDRAFASLIAADSALPVDEALKLLEAFGRSGDERNAPRAVAMMESLLEGDRLQPKERESLGYCLRAALHYREALRPEHLAKATAQVERLVAVGVIERVALDRAIGKLRAAEEGNWGLADSWGAIEAFRAAGMMHGINFKGSDYPPGHDDLIHDLARISRGAFLPEGIHQLRASWIDNGDNYPVQFVHGDRLYRFDVEYRRSSYDFEAVLKAANRALVDAGEPKRFVILGVACPQDVTIAFCDPAALDPIAQESGLRPSVPTMTADDSEV